MAEVIQWKVCVDRKYAVRFMFVNAISLLLVWECEVQEDINCQVFRQNFAKLLPLPETLLARNSPAYFSS